jgi:hypothetical protein
MIFTIPVTAAHIAKGKPQEACDCPVWHAIAEALPWLDPPGSPVPVFSIGPDDVAVYRPATDTALGFRAVSIPLANIARDAICRIDSALPVEPFEFVLDVPDHLVPAAPAGGEH